MPKLNTWGIVAYAFLNIYENIHQFLSSKLTKRDAHKRKLVPFFLPHGADNLLANETARKASPPVIPKVAIARWLTAQVIISLICPANHSRADRLQ